VIEGSAGALVVFPEGGNCGGTRTDREEGSVTLVLWLRMILPALDPVSFKAGLEWATLRNEVERRRDELATSSICLVEIEDGIAWLVR